MRFLLIFFLLLPAWLNAQIRLEGKVTDLQGRPLAAASVFLNTTSIGTTTNENGDFALMIPQGRFDLIVSSIGYQSFSLTVDGTKALHALEVKLQVKAEEMDAVIIESYEKDGWARWGKWFLSNFLGESGFAKKCELKNPEVLKFYNNKADKKLKVRASAPLIIENRALGYFLVYHLENFHFEFTNQLLYFDGYPFFTTMEGNAKKLEKWEKNRLEAYQGSLMHFMRSIYRNRVREEGFEMRKLRKQENMEKRRVKGMIRNSFVTNGTLSFGGSKDSNAYYRNVLQQPDVISTVDKAIVPADSVAFAIDSITAGLEFEDFLLVTMPNIKTASTSEYLKSFPAAGIISSEISLPLQQALSISANGAYYPTTNLLNAGYWAWLEKAGNMLPLDYKPPSR